MIHSNINDVAIMWQETDKKKRLKGLHKTNFNVKKGIEISVGDSVYLGKNQQDESLYWQINEIIEERQSSLSNFNYITTMCEFIKQ